MSKGLTVKRQIEINADPSTVWNALLDPKLIKQYMFGSDATVDAREGGKITYRGEWQGKSYEDTSDIVKFDPEKTLQVTHSSNLSAEDNYHLVTYSLEPVGDMTMLTLEQDNAKNEDQVAEMGKNWEMILQGLKKVVEDSK
jgi:uncharacterized protein YndB with AHSA1/START domain